MFTLDTITSSMFFHLVKWNPELKRTQSRDLLRFLLVRLYDQGRGQLVNAQITIAQGTLATKLGISRQWVLQLCQRLEATGWIEYTAPFVKNGMRASCTFRVGRTLKRLLVKLKKFKDKFKKNQVKLHVKQSFQFSPTKVDKEKKFINNFQKPVGEHIFTRLPLLDIWRKRGGVEND